jgi:hypothetical protein
MHCSGPGSGREFRWKFIMFIGGSRADRQNRTDTQAEINRHVVYLDLNELSLCTGTGTGTGH